MAPILSCFAIGSLVILLRRPWAREIRRSHGFWFDRAYDEAGLAWRISALGVLVLLSGAVFLGIWLLH